ncbi:uracil-DNA glycosylase [Variovorax paradoxus]|uniref:uracil-DNA glycosylase n=1 Tax=Variovorax paradoxus TaxID=34073 RepID=UPI0021ABECAB|nr:uracil-DNA glycosylase [Variovorax paradoxus]UVH57186.1 uracil-DNA glycosylase [Variovorax paradoxus]
MTPTSFVQAMSAIQLPNVFNPYADICTVHDRKDAAAVRRRGLRTLLASAQSLGVDTIWMGRDLGYRGGRRTGLALTDEMRLVQFPQIYPGTEAAKSTMGPAVVERTATEIWAVLAQLDLPPLLWNVFPFHPHEPDQPFTNRKFTAAELKVADSLNKQLIAWLGIRRIIAIGQDAAHYAEKFGVEVQCVRHPSYGGVTDFREGIRKLYGLRAPEVRQAAAQVSLI